MKKAKPTKTKKAAAPAETLPTPTLSAITCPACRNVIQIEATALIDDECAFTCGETIQKDRGCNDCEDTYDKTIREIKFTPTSITVSLDENASIEQLADAYRFVFALRDMVYGSDDEAVVVNVCMD